MIGAPRPSLSRPSSLRARLVEWLAVAALGLWFARWLADPAHAPGTIEGNDIRVFYDGAVLFRSTGNPYGQGFVSPPWFAVLLVPLTFLPFPAAAWLWLALSLMATAAAAWFALQLADVQPSAARALLLTLGLAAWPPGEAGLLLGQNSWIVLLLASAALVAVRRGHAALAGGLLGLALIKPHLVGLLVLGLAIQSLRRDRGRFLMACGATVAALLTLTLLARRAWVPALLAGVPESWNYWGSTVTTNTLLATWLGASEPLRGALALPPLVLGAALVAWLWSRPVGTLPWRGAFTLALTFLVTPYAYPHDYVLLLVPGVVLAAGLLRRWGPLALPGLLGLGWLAWVLPRPWVYDDPARFSTLGVPALVVVMLAVLHRREVDGRPGSAGVPPAAGGTPALPGGA